MARFHLVSNYAAKIFKKDTDIIVIQMVLCGDREVIAKLISKEDFLNNPNPQITK